MSLSKKSTIQTFCAEFSKTNFEHPFKAKLLPYRALAESLNLTLRYDNGAFEFRTRGFSGRLVAKVPA